MSNKTKINYEVLNNKFFGNKEELSEKELFNKKSSKELFDNDGDNKYFNKDELSNDYKEFNRVGLYSDNNGDRSTKQRNVR